MSKDDLNVEGAALVRNIDSVNITTWSDDRRKEFSATFQQRLTSSRFILLKTAHNLARLANERGFLPHKVSSKFEYPTIAPDAGCGYNMYGGRQHDELSEIACTRAADMLTALPSLRNAVNVVDAAVARMMDERDGKKARCEELRAEISDLEEEKSLSDYDQNMKLGDFVSMLKDQTKKRNRLLLEVNEIAKEAYELDRKIDRALGDGIPGLTEAIVEMIQSLIDKCNALEQVGRRVHEKVMFGDSSEAMSILSSFEEDEKVVNDNVKDALKDAVAKLGIELKGRKKPGSKKGKKGGR